MRRTKVFGVLAAIWLLTLAATAEAQMWPGRGGYRGYGSDGAWGAYTAAKNYATTANIAQQNRMAGQQASMQQMAMRQSNIRNTLGSQAARQTQGITSQQQSNRNWWFQVQQQQATQRRSMPMGSAAARAPVAFEPSSNVPMADTEVIPWLPILCDPQFAQQRTRVEAPYRRQPEANPTVEDYKNMLDAADQMKVTLNKLAAQISAQEFLDAVAFLDKLAAEARGRIEQDAPPAKPK